MDRTDICLFSLLFILAGSCYWVGHVVGVRTERKGYTDAFAGEVLKAYTEGHEEGYKEGYEKGHREGYNKGYNE